MTSGKARIFSEVLSNIGATLVLPEVVLRETVNTMKHRLPQMTKEYDGARYRLERYANAPGATVEIGVESTDVGERYQSFILGFLTNINSRVAPIPALDAEHLLNKAVAGKKPFAGGKRGDKGFKDSLIWETVKNLVCESGRNRVAFVTGNSTDFMDSDGELHPDLVEEVQNCSRGSTIRLFLDTSKLVSEWMQPSFEYSSSVEGILDLVNRDEDVRAGIRSELVTSLESLAGTRAMSFDTEWLISYEDTHYFMATEMVELNDFRFSNLTEMNPSTFTATIEANVTMMFEAPIWLEYAEEAAEYVDEVDPGFYEVDGDSATTARMIRDMTINVEAILNSMNGDIRLTAIDVLDGDFS